MMVYYCILAGIGFLLNIWLYVDDIKNRGGILNKVDKGGKDEDDVGLNNLQASPTVDQRRKAEQMLGQTNGEEDQEIDMKIK